MMKQQSFFQEPARDLPLIEDADVIVCGGGPAGFAAAVAAARTGARTRLFEVHGCLGGVWTSGLLTYLFDFDKPGLTRELTARLDQLGARHGKNVDRYVYDPETMKLILEQLAMDAGVQIQLQTRVVAAFKEGKRLCAIATESKTGRQVWRAKVFIDATGDGDLGHFAGCGWEFGRDPKTWQPMTLNALAVVKDVELLREYLSFYETDAFHGIGGHVPATKKIVSELLRAGEKSSYGHPSLFPIRGNLVLFMANHEYSVRFDNAEEMTHATLRARAEVHRLVKALATLGGIWEDFRVVATGEQIGVRDGRRLRGRYTLTQKDLEVGQHFPDGITKVTFGPDIHASSQVENDKDAITHGDIQMRHYEIPLRALIAEEVDGLMMAGRCISGDFIAHSSYRVTGNSVATGEATGIVAALASKNNLLPHELDWLPIETALRHFRT
jgi:hypothetical protein